MMAIAISIGTFILGFLAEKLLDFFYGLFKEKIANRKIKRTLHYFYADAHTDVIITASGIPFFHPKNIKGELSTEEPFLLAKPAWCAKIEDDSSFSSTDRVTDGFNAFIMKNSLQDQLEKARSDVFESFSKKTQGNYFNGTLLGVGFINGFGRTNDAREEPVLNIGFYKTDYYTHKVIEQLMPNVSFNSDILKDLKVQKEFCWMRTSFGVSVILIIPKQNEIILTKRGKNTSYSNGKEWIYVSVTETLSETDYDADTGCPDLRECVKRGIKEELGIKIDYLNMNTLRFYDTFYETNFYQDGIVASVEISDELTFSDIYSLLAKDKYMEVSEILTIQNNKNRIASFIEANRNNMRAQTIFSLESFVAHL